MNLIKKIVCHLVEDNAISTVNFTFKNQNRIDSCIQALKIKSLLFCEKCWEDTDVLTYYLIFSVHKIRRSVLLALSSCRVYSVLLPKRPVPKNMVEF